MDLGLDALERIERITVFAHQHDAADDLVLIILADDSKPRRITDRDVGDVGDLDRGGLAGIEHNLADVVETVEKTEPAHVERLLADAHIIAAGVGVGVLQGRDQRR